ncbi:MAG: acyltransferase [Desulfobacterales bacterium]|nr:acyltransferase [Desulfobacterales bacterium]
MQKDHRPYFLKRALSKFQRFYSQHFLRPHFASLGNSPTVVKPWYVEVFGSPIDIGDYVSIIAAADNRVRLSVWADKQNSGRIRIGDYDLLCPGVRISSASQIRIGDNCMIASGAYVTDSDWHDVYNRIAFGKTDPIDIANNVWIGDSAIVCKGVSIGKNSIIGAGAVVVNSIPSNCIAAGNPAQVVKHLDPGESFTTREQWFSKRPNLFDEVDQLDRQLLGDNTLLHWLRYVFFPSRGD